MIACTEKIANPPQNTRRWRNWFTYFQYEEDRDSSTEVRNVLLVVATLIAAVSFQAGVNPPSGVWQGNDHGHRAGRAINSSEKEAFYAFLIPNTLALSALVLVIMSFTCTDARRFPFDQFEIFVATASMILTYGSAIFAVKPKESVRFNYILLAAAGLFVMRYLIKKFKRIKSTGLSI